jgi:hypothetical protein
MPRLLCTSGYAKSEIILYDDFDEGAEFLPKSYKRKHLIRKVPVVLDEAREGYVRAEFLSVVNLTSFPISEAKHTSLVTTVNTIWSEQFTMWAISNW